MRREFWVEYEMSSDGRPMWIRSFGSREEAAEFAAEHSDARIVEVRIGRVERV